MGVSSFFRSASIVVSGVAMDTIRLFLLDQSMPAVGAALKRE